jgi:hypothetical protein
VNESLSSFVAGAVEYIVGGLMLLGSLVFLASAFSWNLAVTPGELADLQASSASLAVSLLLVALAYAMGVVGESLSRALMEWDLVRVTLANKNFAPKPAEAEPAATGTALTSPPEADTLKATQSKTAIVTIPKSERKKFELERDRQRMVVMTKHVQLYADVESQLKRLRLERVAFVSLVLLLLGFAFREEAAQTLVALGGAALLGWLVHMRFKRYCGAIARAYEIVGQGFTMTQSGEFTTPLDGPQLKSSP